MNAIDPTEGLLSVLGISPFIYRDVPMVTKEHTEAVGRLPATIQAQARKLCRDELTGVGISVLDYDKMLRLLFEDYEPNDLEAAARAMQKNAADLDVPLMAKVADVMQFLRGVFPRSSYTTLEGQDQMEPDPYAVCLFTAILDALDNPMTVFAGMSNASVLGVQVAAVRQVYPTLSAAIEEAVTEMPAELRAAKASFNLPWSVEIGINKWLGKPPVDPDLAALLIQVQAASPMNAPPPPPPRPTPGGSQQAKASLSEAERAQFADASGKVG